MGIEFGEWLPKKNLTIQDLEIGDCFICYPQFPSIYMVVNTNQYGICQKAVLDLRTGTLVDMSKTLVSVDRVKISSTVEAI